MKLSPLINPDIEESLRGDSEYIMKHKILTWTKNASIKDYLLEEEEKLDKLIEVLQSDEESLNSTDEISSQIETLTNELNEINHINLKKLRKLKEIIKIESQSASICYIRTEERPKLRKQEMAIFQKKQMLENNAQKEILLKFLKNTVLKLEQKQLVESIEQITSSKKQKSNIIDIIIIFIIFNKTHKCSKFISKKT